MLLRSTLVALTLLAAATGAAQARQTGPRAEPPGGFGSVFSNDFNAWKSRDQTTNNAKRLKLAQTAAALINEDKCAEAIDLVSKANDPDMLNRTKAACAPVKQASATTH